MRSSVFVLVALVPLWGCTKRIEYTQAPAAQSSSAININTASVDDIEKLPHIGHATAEAIVRFRQENGPFRRPEQILLIRGISEPRFAELRPLIRTE